ncbi:hypothetical protein FFWV33_13355 [Flavobacterium faecale]|uniref:Translocation and assembly module TamB C-terminal domain-containing protein n=1 Tax=Flavobacterium faecale TaxID=1355330 RepID=A0A2S1LF81_9FLAO|nr:translocation/assembly module TamB [Flavobacterium faecale]AWG22440.1 hypothetical protein FFWV33_13355 [Flavobacterium faecale]
MKKAFTIFLKVIAGIVALFLLLVLLLQVSFVQNKVKDYAVSYLEGKIKTKVAIGSIEIGLPKKVILNDFYFEEQSKDTLVAGKSLKVDIDLFQLINSKVQINSIALDDAVANIKVNKVGVFNFDYIIKAFATPDQPKTEESSSTAISIKNISLDKVRFNYQDEVSKNNVSLGIQHFDTKIDQFDLDNLAFDVPEINLKGFKLNLSQDIAEAVQKVAEDVKAKADTKFLQLKLSKINLDDIVVSYQSAVAKMNANIALEHLDTQLESIDLQKQHIVVNEINLSKTTGSVALLKSLVEAKKSSSETAATETSLPWNFEIKKIGIQAVTFAFDNENEVKIVKGMDYNHLAIKDLNFVGESIVANNNAYTGTISSLQFVEKSGFSIQELRTAFAYSDKGASLQKLYLKTPQTTLEKSIIATYPSIASLSEHVENLVVDVNLINSTLGFKDVLLLVPSLISNDVFKNYPNAILAFNAVLKGRVDQMTISNFNASGLGSTKVAFKGNVVGLPNFDKSNFDINSLYLESTAKDINGFVPKNMIPNSIQLPKNFNLKGDFKGSMAVFKTNLAVKSSFGSAVMQASFDQSRKNNEKYIADVSIQNFDVGQLIKNKQLGKITANATINGVSLDPAVSKATFTTKVIAANYNQYNYQNIFLGGSISNGNFDIKAKSSDPNVSFAMDAKGSSNPKKPTVDLKLNVDILDLEKLNLHAGPLKLKGDVIARFDDLSVDNLNGTLSASNFLVALEKEQFPIDSISIKAVSSIARDSIVLKSQFADGVISGEYKLTTIGDALMNSISKYYQFDKKYVAKKEAQSLDFAFTIKDDPILKKLVPELVELSAIDLTGSYQSTNDSIVVKGVIPRINYASNEISNGLLTIDTQANTLNYNVSFGLLKNAQFEVPKTSVGGTITDNTINYQLVSQDQEDKEKYVIGGRVKDSLGAMTVSFDPKSMLLNYEEWVVAPDNFIKIAPKGIQFSDFEIKNGNQAISIQSENNKVTGPVVAKFENFKIETLTNIAKTDFDLGGTINGETVIKNLTTNPLFVADLKIENLKIKEDSVGDLQLKVANKNADVYTANVGLSGLGNQMNIDGSYTISSSNLDFDVLIDKLQIKSLQAFATDYLKDSEGFIDGKMKVKGQASSPVVEGALKFNSVNFVVVPLNSKYQLNNDQIVFRDKKIVFDDFKLQDENKNPLKVTGFIDTNDYTNVGFNLNIDAKNFRAVNSTSKDNKLFYGELFLDNNLGIKGTMNSPVVDGTIKVNEDTKFSIVLPQSDPSIADREGIVEFIDQDQPVLITVEDPMKDIVQTQFTGIDATVNIVVDKKAEISIVIDESNGDYLKLQGEAQLTGGIDPSGKTTLTGKYEFTGGAYEMNFNLIKRKFEIQPDSYILWTGEPTTANINITAVYKVDASPLDLVDDQLTGITDETRNTYKQKIPFETNLIMKGELLQPEISFDIVLPDGNNDVSAEIINTTQAKLTQLKTDDDAMNKQVFALLLLNRFIGENPFSSEAGGTSGAYLAKQSVSKILSQQLNNLAGDLIKGIQIDFDLQATEDYSTGEKKERTDLNVGLSKQLFNDRLKVTLGSSFGVEGAQNANEQATNIAGDVTADYLLTTDGRYKVRAYRKNNYQVALQGQVVETGVAFIITMNYNKFKELFQTKQRTDKNKENRKPKKDENK